MVLSPLGNQIVPCNQLWCRVLTSSSVMPTKLDNLDSGVEGDP